MSGSFDDKDRLVIGDGKIICCFGPKGSGKSVIGRLILNSFPGDRLVIAVNHDDGPFAAPDQGIHEITGDVSTLPVKWPEHLREDREHLTIRCQLDIGSPTDVEDQDHCVGLALRHGHTAILVHEVGLLAPNDVSKKRIPNVRRVLHANRHSNTTAIFCGPRPCDINAMVYGQADVIYMFYLPLEQDRIKMANRIGWELDELTDAMEELGPFEYLRFDAREPPKPPPGQPDRRLVLKPAIPAEYVQALP